ncbi:MAG: RHS repeat-associated core domain-containing protein [Acidobacteria bacterium]|nr:RHS repeat-associated core domain-containing protein [Acidobacteriota bacterium]
MRKAALGLLCLALPLAAAYTYFLTDTFASGVNATTWQSNGTIAGDGTAGLYSTATNGGSVIYKNAITDGVLGTDVAYEVRATLKIGASGGTFVLYSHATTDALTGPAAQGSFYAVEMTPTLSGGGCSMAVNYYRRASGTVTLVASHTIACKDGMTVRLAQRSAFYIFSTSLNEFDFLADSTIASGRPGAGARSLPSGNGLSEVRLANAEYTPPGAVSSASIRTALFDTRVDLAWQGVVDDANGSGLLLYQVHRTISGGSPMYMGNVRGAYFSDTTVSPGTTYTYTIYPHDMYLNNVGTSLTITTPAAGQRDPRKVGVRPLGTYWGASPENIDLQSGNLSFSLPTVTGQGRGGSAVPFRVSYNSQNWRKDPSGTWMLGTDVGFGWGWKMLAGSVTPVYSDWYTIHHYVYTDSTGAEYDLDVNTGGIWTSKAGIFVEFDSIAKRLYFPSGVFWEFDCTANGTEADMGTMYPTRLVDTNGNEIKLRYQGGLYYGGTNGSARVTALEDVRSINVGSGVYRTYQFNYNTDAIPHLTGIVSDIGDGVNYSFSYSSGNALSDPFTAASFGTATRMNSMTFAAGMQFAMEYAAGSQELTKVTMPYGGTLEWVYAAKTIAGTRTQMEVQYRKLNAQDGQGVKTYTLYHDDNGDLSRLAHSYTVVVDASGAADKAYFFNYGNDWKLGLMAALSERQLTPTWMDKRSNTLTWAQTANGNPYISASEEVIDPAVSGVAKASRVEQTVDDHGNMTQKKQYGYFTPGGTAPLIRTYTYNYMTGGTYANYTSRHIWNRLLTATVQKPGGAVITLVTNLYDIYPYGAAPGVAFPALLRQHDDANYNSTMIYRGNLSTMTTPAKTVSFAFDGTGNVLQTSDSYGHTAAQVMDENKNYAVPKSVSGGSLTTSMSWNSYNAPMSSTGPNSDTMSFSYDTYARPATTTAPNGSVTNYTYASSGPFWKLATTGTRWSKTWIDGFGRPLKVESGYNTGSTPTTVSIVETKYTPCACTPIGKLWKTSLPYAPGGTPIWTEHVYDALGRTVQVIQPNGSGTTATSYSGVEVTVTDPAGKWKKFENDALGRLVKVTEPRPGGGSDYVTTYTYSVEFGQLLTTTMSRPGLGSNPATVTQTRTWVYDGTTQRLNSVTHPESGTTSFTYNSDGTLLRKTDQKGQKIEYTYDSDGRVTAARRYLTGGSEDTCMRVDYYYGSQTFDGPFTANATGRLAATATGCMYVGAGQVIEMYSYTSAGAVAKKRLRLVRGAGTVDKDVSYSYGSDGKLATVTYPGYSTPFTYTYDLMDRPTKMTGPSMFDGSQIDHAKDVVYGVAGQVTSMKYLSGEATDVTTGGVEFTVPSYFTETKTYNALYQLTRQTTAGAADIEYIYSSTANNGRIIGRNNYVSGENVVYSYDELNRLVGASVSSSSGWGQSFTYDGFGNLWTQSVTKGTAPSVALSVDMATNRISGWGYDGNGNTTSRPALGGGLAMMTYDVDNRMLTWTKDEVGTEEYQYLSDNKRVWKKAPDGTETVYFYGVGGQKLATYRVQSSPFALTGPSINVYFGGKLIRADGVAVVHDRLGSVVARSGCAVGCTGAAAKDYFPYGDEIGSATSGNQDKFGTYHRDSTTGLDYADQRYFAGTMGGRFLSADPYEASGGASEPGSWNRYKYAAGDPINRFDPKGLQDESPPHNPLDQLIDLYLNGLKYPEVGALEPAPLADVPDVFQDSTRWGRGWALEGLKKINSNKECSGVLNKPLGSSKETLGQLLADKAQNITVMQMWDPTQMNASFGETFGGRVDLTVGEWIDQQNPGIRQADGGNLGGRFVIVTSQGASTLKKATETVLHELLHLVVGNHTEMAKALGVYQDFSSLGPVVDSLNSSSEVDKWLGKCLGNFQ